MIISGRYDCLDNSCSCHHIQEKSKIYQAYKIPRLMIRSGKHPSGSSQKHWNVEIQAGNPKESIHLVTCSVTVCIAMRVHYIFQ